MPPGDMASLLHNSVLLFVNSPLTSHFNCAVCISLKCSSTAPHSPVTTQTATQCTTHGMPLGALLIATVR